MKKIKISLSILLLILTTQSCKKSILDLSNPNSPGLGSLESEEGLRRTALGIYGKFGLEYWWLGQGYHNSMGDTYFISAGNFSWRWANQPTSITLSNGTVLTPPQGGSQIAELRARNDRSFGNDNAFLNEWQSCYFVNNQANLLLEALKSPKLNLGTDAETKKKIINAWAYWWKGFAYSRIGSIYIAGLVNSETNKTTGNFVTNKDIIVEANKNFDLAIQSLNGLTVNATYTDLLRGIIPDFTQIGKGGVPTPDMWIRNMNTYKARNLLVNKEVSAMTTADWTAVKDLATNGIRQSDVIFTMRSANANDLVSQTAWAPARLLLFGWEFVSERLVQDFKPGDARATRNLTTSAPGYPVVNRSGRGFQYGTRYRFIPIENGGNYASTTVGLAEIPIAGSFEENELMLAEANIKLNLISTGLQSIDRVRVFQNANLASLSPLLTASQAYEELRRERRIGLINKGVSFYDARRWGVIKPVANGGGRTGAVVIGPNGVVDNNATINYNYLSYWDVPKNELDFNTPLNPAIPVIGN